MLRKLIVPLVGLFVLVPPLWAQQKPYAPLPQGARGPAIPQKGYLVEEIKDGVYWVTEGRYQALIITTGEGVIVVDAPATIGPNLLKAISDVTKEPVKYFIYSHQHKDHVGFAHILPSGTTYVAHDEIQKRLGRTKDPHRPVPSVTFSDRYVLTLGNKTVELSYKGVNHEPGNIFIYLPKQKILMVVDIVYPGWVPFKDFGLAKNIPGFFRAYDQVLEYEFDYFVGGHLTRLGNRQDVLVGKEYIADVQANAQKALQKVDIREIIKKIGFANPYTVTKTYYDAVADECAKLTEPKWIPRLGGADIYTFDHCWIMRAHIQMDY